MMPTTIDPLLYRNVLGTYPTGVTLITAMHPAEGPVAMVIGSFGSVSLEPPLVGFFVVNDSKSWALIAQTGKFCVNVLGSDQAETCRLAARGGPERLQDITFGRTPAGLPTVSDALTMIECTIHDVQEAGDHRLVLGLVTALEIRREGDPLLFHRGRYGGFSPLAG